MKKNQIIDNKNEGKKNNNIQSELHTEKTKIDELNNVQMFDIKRILTQIFYQNCRGFGSKERIIHASMLACQWEIIILVETWLTVNHNSCAYFPDKFNVYRRDRKSIRPNGNEIKKGGLVMAVKKNLISEQIDLGSLIDIEYLCVKIKLKSFNIIIYSLYIPPKSDISIYKAHVDQIKNIQCNEEDILLVIGDLNIPNIDWIFDDECDCYLPTNISSNVASNTLLALQAEGLFQINEIKNASDNVLDLVYTNNPNIMKLNLELNPISQPIDSAHLPFVVQMELDCCSAREKSGDNWFYSFKSTNFNEMSNFLATIDFESLFCDKLVDDQIDIFNNKMNEACEKFANKIPNNKSKSYPWENNKRLINLKNRIRKAKKLLAKSKTSDNQFKYEMLCNEYSSLYKNIYENYLNNIQKNFASNPKAFWSFVKLKRSNSNYPNVMKYKNEKSHDNDSMANIFATFFSSIYKKSDNTRSDILNLINESPNDETNNKIINCNDVLNAIKKLNVKKGKGPDMFPPSVYKYCAFAISIPISIIMNNSLNSGSYPELLKNSCVTPIFKSGAKNEAMNYRSVSVVSPLSKIFELVLIDMWSDKINEKLSIHQHGFTKQRSTLSNLAIATTDYSKAIVKKLQTDIIFTDFEKAFDRVDHYRFIKKAIDFGFDRNSLKLMLSFLTNRSNYVKIENALSKPFVPTSGVPAGCCLSSHFFNIFINDASSIIEN